jgi:hypothetical protein
MFKRKTTTKNQGYLERHRYALHADIRPIKHEDIVRAMRAYADPDPAPMFLAVDARTCTIYVDLDETFGCTTSDDVRRGLVYEFPLPLLTAETANNLMREIAPLAEQLTAGVAIYPNWIGIPNDSAYEAIGAIQKICSQQHATLYWIDVADWLWGDERVQNATPEDAYKIACEIEREIEHHDGRSADFPIVLGSVYQCVDNVARYNDWFGW